VIALCVLVGACVGDGVGAGTRWSTEFEYFRWGGLCPTPEGGGTCEIRVVVRDDGTWSATGVPEPVSQGTLPLGAATELASIFGQSWRYFTEVPFTDVCPTAYDGEEYGYVVREIPFGAGAERADMRVREVRSCIYDLERYDSLVKRNMIEEAWKALKPPELAHVEFR
jgi:hypothetical protein